MVIFCWHRPDFKDRTGSYVSAYDIYALKNGVEKLWKYIDSSEIEIEYSLEE